MSTITKTRKYFIRSYLTEEQLKNIIEKNLSIIYRWAYAYHDKDKHDDGTNKEKHVHLFIEFTQPYAISKPRNLLKNLIDEKGKEMNHFIEPCKKTTAHCIQYLIHKGHDQKYQYNTDIIQSYNIDIDYMLSLDLSKTDGDNTFDIVSQLVEKGFTHTNLLNLASTYGKDFVYHYTAYEKLAKQIISSRTEEALTFCYPNADGEIITSQPLGDTQSKKLDKYFS